MNEQNGLTIIDVAQAAGVSVSTVSRILNGKQDVAAATRERVLKVIETLGYAPQAHAQRLRGGRTQNIALVFPVKLPSSVLYNPLDTQFIVSAAAAAGENSYFFSLLTAPVTKQSLLNMYRSAQVDGLVLMQIHLHDWRVDLLRQEGYPFVMIGHCEDNQGLNFIDLDFEASTIMAFEHLAKSGHQKIALITFADSIRQSGYGPAVRVWSGYQQVLQQTGLPAIYREVSFAEQSVFEAALDLIDTEPDVTAILTPHADGALGIIQALHLRGRRIPYDCSIIGITANQIAAMTTPPLTNIEFPSGEMGHRAVEILLRLVNNEQPQPEQILIPPRLILRDSTVNNFGQSGGIIE